MIIKLDKKSYELAKTVDFSELGDHIQFNDYELSIELDDEPVVLLDYFDNEYELSPIKVLLGCISDEVVLTGLTSDQNEVLPRGRELYALYDGIYYSLPTANK